MNVVPVVFDLRETKLGFLGVDSDVLSAKELEYTSDEYAQGMVSREEAVVRYLPLDRPVRTRTGPI
jgi:hypothetical protein